MPFDITLDVPDAETPAALKEGDKMINDPNAQRFSSVDALFEDLMKRFNFVSNRQS